jgi:hypothetical protein
MRAPFASYGRIGAVRAPGRAYESTFAAWSRICCASFVR